MQPRYVLIRRPLAAALLFVAALIAPACAEDQNSSPRIQEELWALPLPLPMFAYLVRPEFLLNARR